MTGLFFTRLCLLSSVLLTACAQHQALINTTTEQQAFYGSASPQRVTDNALTKEEKRSASKGATLSYSSDTGCSEMDFIDLGYHYRADKPLIINQTAIPGRQQMHDLFSDDLALSPGDMIQLSLTNGDGFEGRYIINPDGRIQLPLVKAIDAAGLNLEELAIQIELSLVRAQLFKPHAISVGLRVLQWAAIEVTVSGAVFAPGRVLINNKIPEQVMPERIAAFGDYTPSRNLSEALRSASGVRPDAKLDQIILVRNGWQFEIDLSGVISGSSVKDIPLIAGDRIIVPTTGCFQSHLARPSQITPKGFRVFMSNVTRPIEGNAAPAVGKFSSSLPYGTRLLQAAVSGGCVGGVSWISAPRRVMLASKNPMTGRTEVIDRSIDNLFRQAQHDDINPYLMPNDAIACYDSDVTNFRDVAKSIVELIIPFKLL
jgi:polysaccharide export outer membrane protein